MVLFVLFLGVTGVIMNDTSPTPVWSAVLWLVVAVVAVGVVAWIAHKYNH